MYSTLLESEADAKELTNHNASNLGTLIVISWFLQFCFRLQQSGFQWIISYRVANGNKK